MSGEAWALALTALVKALIPIVVGAYLGWQLNNGFRARRRRKDAERLTDTTDGTTT